MTAKTFAIISVVAAGTAFAQTPKTAKQMPQKTFDSPEAATQALIDAASKNDTATLRAVLGSSAKGILTSGDAKEDAAERRNSRRLPAKSIN